MFKNLYLTDNELKAIETLAEYDSYSYVREVCEIPMAGMPVFVVDLKRKTGIRDTKHMAECAEYLKRYASAMASLPPTDEQLWLLKQYLAAETYMGIAYQLTLRRDCAPLTAQDMPPLMDSACAAVGIFSRDDRARRVQIRTYLAYYHPKHEELFPTEERFLRMWVAGKAYPEIADAMGERREYVQAQIKSACRKLGLCAKGRGVQRNLVRAYFAHFDAQTVTMDDPAFN